MTTDRALLEIPYHQILVVVNPIAGRGRAEGAAARLAELLERAGARATIACTRGRGDGAEQARRRHAGTDLIVVVGGDGTLADVLSGTPPELPLAVLSMGTANVLALDLGLARSPEGLLALLARDRRTGLDVAEVGGRLSFLVTGVGIDGAIVRAIDRHRSGPISKLTYIRAALATLWRWRAPRLCVTVDGRRLEGSFGWVLVSNIIGYGGFMKLSPDRVLDDGLLEVFLFPRGTRLAFLGYALRGVLRHLPGGDCRMLRAREVTIESADPVPYQVDGDYGGETPLTIRWNGRRHRVCIP